MILQRLKEHYDRLLESGEIDPPGIEKKKIPYVIEINSGGVPKAILFTEDRIFSVPAGVKRAVNIKSNLLYDNIEYVLGVPRPNAEEAKVGKVSERHRTFVERIQSLPQEVKEDEGVGAVLKFLDGKDVAVLKAFSNWEDLQKGEGNISFKLEGAEGLICEREVVKELAIAEAEGAEDAPTVTCLISGKEGPLARLHPPVKNVKGKEAQPTGTNITTFNAKSFESHGWKQGQNALITNKSAIGYVGALNHLLSSRDHYLVEGNCNFVFWAEEDDKAGFIKEVIQGREEIEGWGSDEENEDKKSDVKSVRKTLLSVRTGLKECFDDQSLYYVLSITPNSSRIEIQGWHEGTVDEFARKMWQHFEDLSIAGLNEDENYSPGIWGLLGAASKDGDPKILPDRLRGNLASDIIRATLQGTPYPARLLTRTVSRCQVERKITTLRAALIKAILNRRSRFSDRQEEITVELDLGNMHTGYLLGRLFAVLRKIQEDSSRDQNVTILDQYFGSASTCPRAAFLNLMRLKNAHMKKLRRDNPGYAVRNEKVITEIMDKLDGKDPFPPYLDLEEQGKFIVGYYHQTSDLYKKRDKDKEAISEDVDSSDNA